MKAGKWPGERIPFSPRHTLAWVGRGVYSL